MRPKWLKAASMVQNFNALAIFNFVHVFISLKDHSFLNLFIFTTAGDKSCGGHKTSPHVTIAYSVFSSLLGSLSPFQNFGKKKLYMKVTAEAYFAETSQFGLENMNELIGNTRHLKFTGEFPVFVKKIMNIFCKQKFPCILSHSHNDRN